MRKKIKIEIKFEEKNKGCKRKCICLEVLTDEMQILKTKSETLNWVALENVAAIALSWIKVAGFYKHTL